MFVVNKKGWLGKRLNRGIPARENWNLPDFAASQRSDVAMHHAWIANIQV